MALSKAWLTVFGGFLIHLILGTLYLWANITSAVTSRLKKYDAQVTYSETINVFAAVLAAQGATMLLGGILAQKLGPKLTCSIGGSLIVIGNVLASLSQTLASMIVCQGILLGFGLGICYTAPIAAAVRHLPHRKGLVTGIIVGGFGCGAFVFGFFALHLVNPHRDSVASDGEYENYFPPDSNVVANVPRMFRILACTYAAVIAVGVACISEPEPSQSSGDSPPADGVLSKILTNPRKQEYHSTATGDVDNPTDNPIVEMAKLPAGDGSLHVVKGRYVQLNMTDGSVHGSAPPPAAASAASEVNYSFGEILRMPITYHVMSCFITTTVGGMYLAGTFKTYGQQTFHDEGFLIAVSALSSIFNFLGRVFWGAVSDRMGPVRTLMVMSLIFTIAIFTYSSSVLLGEAGFALYTFLIFFCEGGNFVLYMPLTIMLFGAQNAASNYGLIFTSYSIFVVLNITILARFHVSFYAASVLMGILTGIGFLNVISLHFHMQALTSDKAADEEERKEEECMQRPV